MATSNQLSIYAQTAFAAYATDLLASVNNVARYVDADMSQAQAEQFDATWEVLQQSTATLNGFSAVLLKNKLTDEKVLAITGTNSVSDFITDFASIAIAGSIVGMPQYSSLQQFYQQLISQGLLTSTESISVTGHSLGGFLAQAFAVIHSDVVSAAYTYNAPGFAGALGELSDYLGVSGSLPGDTITNVRAVEGLSVTAGLGILVGTSQDVHIEAGAIPGSNHSIIRLSDSLAVQALLAELDPGISDWTLGSLVQGASNEVGNTLESLLDAVRRIFVDPTAASTPEGDRAALYTNLKVLGDALKAGGALEAVAGLLHISPVGVTLASDARTEFTALVSLSSLSPLVLRGINSGSQVLLEELLGGVHAGLYAQWQSDLNLTNAERAAGKANFSDAWLEDRAAMLRLVVEANVLDENDSLDVSLSGGVAMEFQDLASGIVIETGGGSEKGRIVFGTGGDDGSMSGSDFADRLYGGSGEDTLSGDAGDDYLEGGADNDHLSGGADNDELVGGEGNDILHSGAGRDTLRGGSGNDAYWVDSGAEFTTIADADGSGAITIEKLDSSFYDLGSNLAVIPGTAGIVKDGHGNRYSLAGGNLSIVLADGRSILVKNFQSGQLGITLPGQQQATSPSAPNGSTLYTVQQGGPNVNSNEFRSPAIFFPLANPGPETIDLSTTTPAGTYTSIAASGGFGDSHMIGGSHRDVLIDDVDISDGVTLRFVGDAVGDDVLMGGGGNDVLETHGGDDRSYGGEGDDLIIDRPTQAFTSYGDTSWVDGAGHSNRDLLYGEAGNDVIVAGAGDGYLDGGDDNDELYGGAGTDVLVGGGGNDFLSGDTRLNASVYTYSYSFGVDLTVSYSGQFIEDAIAPGNDELYGGDGEDTLLGGGGGDTLFGGADNDKLLGDTLIVPGGTQAVFSNHGTTAATQQGDDDLFGEGGDDFLWGGGGSDYLDGGTENDVLYGDRAPTNGVEVQSQYHGDDWLTGGSGSDFLYGDGGSDRLFGDDGNDNAFGGSGNDRIWGGAGEDYLVGDEDGDTVGSDSIYGGDDDDTILGGGGGDFLYGNAGSDVLVGGNGPGFSNTGNDRLEGNEGDDFLYGQDGNDILIGGQGQDVANGQEGDDRIEADSGSDLLYGEAGNDTFVLSVGAGHVQITDAEGSNVLEFGDGISARDLRVRTSGSMVYVDFSDADYAFMQVDTFKSLQLIKFADGSTWTPHDLMHSFTPGSVGADREVAMMPAASIYQTFNLRWNNDLLVFYSGSETDWIDTAGLDARGVMYEFRNGSEFGYSSGLKVLSIINHYLGDPATWLTRLNHASQGSTLLRSDAAAYEGSSGNDLLLGNAGHPSERFYAGDGDDILKGLNGDNEFHGGAGNDVMVGGAGNDDYVYAQGDGADVVQDAGGINAVIFESGITSSDLTVTETAEGLSVQVGPDPANHLLIRDWSLGAAASVNEFYFKSGNFSMGRSAIDALNTGNHSPRTTLSLVDKVARSGMPFEFVVSSGIFVDADAGDTLAVTATLEHGAALPAWLSFDPQTMTFSGTPSAEHVGVIEVHLTAVDEGGLATSALFDLQVKVPVVITGTAGNESLSGLSESEFYQIYGLGGSDILLGNIGDDILDGGDGYDQLDGQAGDDTLIGGEGDDNLNGSYGDDLLYGGDGNDYLRGETGANLLYGGAGNDTLYGSAATIHDWYLDEYFYGNTSSMWGGDGNDTYYISAGNMVVEEENEGIDTVSIGADYVLGENFENLALSGSGLVGEGNDLDNTIFSQYGGNTLRGGLGNDTYSVTYSSDTIIENAGEGIDTVQSWGSYTLGDNLENLTLTGMGALTATGNSLDNVLRSGGNNNTLIGGLGNDTYHLNGTGNVIVEGSGEGTDTVVSAASYVLGNDLENLTLSGVANINGTGNALDNIIIGNGGSNLIDGGSGADIMIGGNGVDAYFVDDVNDLIVENADEGEDYVESSVSYTLGANLEDLSLGESTAMSGTGNELNNRIFGNGVNNVLSGGDGDDSLYGRGGDDFIDGGAGADVMNGDSGNDTYVVDNAGDAIEEFDGIDNVLASVTYTLGSGIENLTLTGSGDIGGTGNTLGNVLTGNSGNNSLSGGGGADTLDGGAGNDAMSGGSGNDIYIVDSILDAVSEASSQGTDTVRSSVDWTLGSNVENLLLLGTGNIAGTGNTLSNTITGNSGHNTLDAGTAGTDVLAGGLGDDTYVIGRTSGITVSEGVGEGTDLVNASVSYTLGSNLENLTLTGTSAINGTGNGLDNVITGNGGVNTLSGGAGVDSLIGGAGNDIYVVSDTSDSIVENAGEGTDTVQSSVTYSLSALVNVENLTLTGTSNINGSGNSATNTITGNSGNNVLDGGAGVDTLIGGAGNDTYIVDSAGETITEGSSAGTDLVQSSVTFALVSNVENLMLTGSDAIDGTGNTLSNTITGNAGNNVLDAGSAGTDVLIGGLGDDRYIVGRTTGITVTENAGEGTDTVQSSVTYTLGSNVENLVLTGSSALNGTGNTLDNALTGNSGSNTLTGGGGNDTLDPGSAGTDSLVGGSGNDVYILNRSSGVTITESSNEGIDAVNASVTATLGNNIEMLFMTGSSAINGTGNTLSNLLRGNSGTNTLAGGTGVDILEGDGGNDILSDSGGNTLMNGGDGADTLTSGTASDMLIGGLGNDSITTGSGADIIVFNQGEGQDTVASSTTQDNVLSLGGGITYADLLFQKSGNNLILKAGGTDQITFTNYYSSAANRSVDKLQIVIEGTSDYDAGSGDALRNKKIETFDFDGLVAAFDTALAGNPSMTSWALTNALLAQHLGGSDTAAIGGDLAYRYGRFDSMGDISFTPALGILGAGTFGMATQALQPTGNLQDSSPRLS